MTTQWHPLFVKVLRPVVESHYEIQTDVPVGDAPRQADIVLLRRTTNAPLPFQGLWANLTAWNVLEFKGPTVSPRVRDLDLLVELGLGIDRRLNEERARQRLPVLGREEVSLWYVANRLGRRFLRDAEHVLGPLEPCAGGIWRCSVLQRMVFLISRVELPIDVDSLPLHVLGKEPPATELAVARFVVDQLALWQLYSPWLEAFHSGTWEEVQIMARAAGRKLPVDMEPFIERVGPQRVLEEITRIFSERKRQREGINLRPLIDCFGWDQFVKTFTEDELRELKRRLQ